jgi:hypothetical protein
LTEDGLQRGLCDFYCIWDLYLQYLANEQLMLNRRTALLINYENCNRNWDKAKAHKRDEVLYTSLSFCLFPPCRICDNCQRPFQLTHIRVIAIFLAIFLVNHLR